MKYPDMAATHVPPTGYWWKGRANFGDLLTPYLLEYFADISVQWAPIDQARLVCVGSVLDLLPVGWSGMVLGSGVLRPIKTVDLSAATVLALRGPLTLKQVTGVRGDPVLGDPGLLAGDLVEVDKVYDLGLIPHWSDTELEKRKEFQRYNPHVIRVNGDPLEVIREIGRCRKVVSSSLHGVILADAMGIPRRTEMAKIFAREGGDFKFRDYCETVNLPFKVGVTQEPSRIVVQSRQEELYDVFKGVGRRLMGLRG